MEDTVRLNLQKILPFWTLSTVCARNCDIHVLNIEPLIFCRFFSFDKTITQLMTQKKLSTSSQLGHTFAGKCQCAF